MGGASRGELPALEFKVIADSEENFEKRIYSYDMAVDAAGNVHLVYLKPTSGDNGEVIYLRRTSSGWSQTVLTTAAYRASISTRLVVDSANVAHVCYIKNDLNLYYRRVNGTTPGTEHYIGPGAWHTRMQLDGNGYPMFIRENETWPNPVSSLVLTRTTDGTTWDKQYLQLPAVNKFRVGEFVYKDGIFHITYGDNIESRPVLAGKDSTTTIQGIFHNLYYATSSDGQIWNVRMVDAGKSLYEMEFWTDLVVNGSTPLVAMYSYAEYNNEYNTGTSALLAEWSGAAWIKTNITPADYPETREGMGVGLAVAATGEVYGAWDFSPDNTHDDEFRGSRGNIAVARSGADGSWREKWQLAPFSAEGKVEVRIRNNHLFLLSLGDFVDSKLYFWEIDLDQLGATASPVTLPPDPRRNGENALPPIYMLLQ